MDTCCFSVSFVFPRGDRIETEVVEDRERARWIGNQKF